MVDIVLLVILGIGFVSGLVSGAIKQFVSLAAFVVGFVIACFFYQRLGTLLSSFVSLPAACNVVAFILLWVVVPIIAGLVSNMLTSLLDKIYAVGTLNRLLGGILGVAKYALVLGAIIWFLSSANVISEEVTQGSRLYRPLKAVPEYVYNMIK